MSDTMKMCANGEKCLNPKGSLPPATTEYFNTRKDSPDGLRNHCKVCRAVYKRQWQQSNKESRAEYYRQWSAENKDLKAEMDRQYREVNREIILEKKKEYYQQNKREILGNVREWGIRNPDRLRENKRNWQKRNPENGRIKAMRYAARKKRLPDAFTLEQWHSCLEYFNYTCAVCGVQLRDLFGNVEPHADHWIPLNSPDCPGTIVTNMVCLCNGCNLSKQDKSPENWLMEKYGTRKAREISERIREYFHGRNDPAASD